MDLHLATSIATEVLCAEVLSGFDLQNTTLSGRNCQNCQNRYMNEEFRTVAQVAEMLGVSRDTVRRLFSNEPGVIDLGQPEVSRGKRRYRVLRIPGAVVARFLERRSVK